MANYHGILQGGTGSFSIIKLGDAGSGASAGTAFITSSAGGVDLYSINKLTASYAKITELDVVTLNSVTTTQENLNVSASLIVASDGAAAADEADGSGLYISGAAASLTWDNSNSRLAVNKAFFGSSTAQFTDDLTVGGEATLGDAVSIAGDTTFGGGYGSTGVTITAAGALSMNAALTVGGDATFNSACIVTPGQDFRSNSVNIDGGAIDATTIGAASAAAGSFTTLAATGDVDLGSNWSDKISFGGDVDTDIKPTNTDTNALGSNAQIWQKLYVSEIEGSSSADDVKITSILSASQASRFVGAASFDSTISGSGATTLGSTLSVSGAATIEGSVSGAAGTFDALAGTSLALQSGGITAAGAIAGASTITSTGLVSGSGGLIGMGATTLGSTLAVSGASTLAAITATAFSGSSTLQAVGAATLGSTLAVSGAATFGSYISASSYVSASSFSLGENSATIEYSDALDLSLGSTKYAALSTDYFSSSVEVQGPTVHTSGSVTAGTSFIIGSADLNEADMEKLDGITNGAGAANKALVLDASADIASGLRSVTGSGNLQFANAQLSGKLDAATLQTTSTITAGGTVTAVGSFIIGSADLNEADMEKIDEITNGAGAANKALVLDASADIASGLRSVTGSGNAKFAGVDLTGRMSSATAVVAGAITGGGNADFTGDLTVGSITMTEFTVDSSGNTDVDGTLNVQGAATFQSTGDFAGHLTPNVDTTYNLGSASKRWANIYTGDLHLKNERGNWTIFEESDHLRVRNNLTGKMYKMGLTPINED
jgi:hypothetical protein